MNLPLEIARLRAGLSKIQLAQRAGIRRDRLSMIVHGWVNPTDAERARVAAALGETEAAIFGSVEADAVESPTNAGAHAHA